MPVIDTVHNASRSKEGLPVVPYYFYILCPTSLSAHKGRVNLATCTQQPSRRLQAPKSKSIRPKTGLTSLPKRLRDR